MNGNGNGTDTMREKLMERHAAVMAKRRAGTAVDTQGHDKGSFMGEIRRLTLDGMALVIEAEAATCYEGEQYIIYGSPEGDANVKELRCASGRESVYAFYLLQKIGKGSTDDIAAALGTEYVDYKPGSEGDLITVEGYETKAGHVRVDDLTTLRLPGMSSDYEAGELERRKERAERDTNAHMAAIEQAKRAAVDRYRQCG